MNLKERVKELCKRHGKSMNQVEKDLGFGTGYISKLDKSVPNTTKIRQLAEYFNVTVDYLMGTISENAVSTGNKSQRPSSGVVINVLGRVAAGIPIDAVEEIIDTEEITQEMAATGTYFGLKIKGDSMEPKISEGDVVIVRQQDDAESGDIIIALVNGDEATCKRLKKYSDGIMLLSNNPKYDPMVFSQQEIIQKPVRIIGRVVELRAKF